MTEKLAKDLIVGALAALAVVLTTNIAGAFVPCPCVDPIPPWEPPTGTFTNDTPCEDVDENMLLKSDFLCYRFSVPTDIDTFFCNGMPQLEPISTFCIADDLGEEYNDIHHNHNESSLNVPPVGFMLPLFCPCEVESPVDIAIGLSDFEVGTNIVTYYIADGAYACSYPDEGTCSDGMFIARVSFYVQDPACFDQVRFDRSVAKADGTDTVHGTAVGVEDQSWYLEGMAYDTYIDPTNGTVYAGTKETRVNVGVKNSNNTTCSRERPVDVGSDCAGGGCEGGGCAAGNENVELGSVDVTISLGSLDGERSAGSLWVHADMPSQFLGTPAAWSIQPPEGVDPNTTQAGDPWRYFAELGIPQAIIAPQAVVHFSWPFTGDTSSETWLDFYSPSDLDPNGEHEYDVVPTATPYLRWAITATGDGVTTGSLTLTKSIDPVGSPGNSEASYAYTVTGPNQLSLYSDFGDGQERIETETLTYDANGRLIIRDVVASPSSGSGYHFTDTYTQTLIGNVVTSHLEYISDNPIATQLTTFEYYDASATPSHLNGHLRSILYPDGSWEWRSYDSSHRLSEVRRPLGNYALPVGTDPDLTFCIQTVYSYDASSQTTGFDRHPTLIMRYEGSGDNSNPGSFVVGRMFLRYEMDDIYLKETISRCLDENALESDPANLVTQTWYRDYDKGLIRAVVYPDDRMIAIESESGSYSDVGTPEAAAFTPGAGSYRRETVYFGTAPAGGGLTPDLYALKSTKDTTVADGLGKVVLTETHVYTGAPSPADFARVGYVVNKHDAYGHTIRRDRSNGEIETWQWGCCHLESYVGADGTVVEFHEYDGEGRVKSYVDKGFNGSTDITHTFERDGLGRVVQSSITGGTTTQTIEREFDQLGRLDVEFDIAQVETDYEYGYTQGGGESVTIHLPGGIYSETLYRLDGKTDAITGSAGVDEFYDFGVDAEGRRYQKVVLGNEQTGPYITRFYDLVGRKVEELRPGFGGSQLKWRWIYEGSRLARKVTETLEDDGQGGETINLKASTCYAYDKLLTTRKTCDDLDFDGVIDLVGPDRVKVVDASFEKDGSGNWWSVVSTSIYPEESSTTPLLMSESKTMLSGFEPNVSSFSKSRDVSGNETFVTIAVDRPNRTVTETRDTPNSSQSEISVIENRLLKSITTSNGLTYLMGYDEIGRRNSITDPRTGPTETFFDANGRVDYITDGAGKRVTFEYDQWGRRKGIKNDDDDWTRYEYNNHGQLYRAWGNVAPPIEIGFDSVYFRRTTLKTFRDSSVDWTGITWPANPGAADVTTWGYDELTGLVTNKTDASGNAVGFQYYADLSLKRRSWSRLYGGSPLYTEYLFHPTGELKKVDYSDSTEDIEFTYNRTGLLDTIIDAAGTHSFEYDEGLRRVSETIVGPLYNKVITRNYEQVMTPLGRYTGLSVGPDAQNPTDDYEATIGYDDFSRVKSITGPGLLDGKAEYQYLEDSNLIEEVHYFDSTQTLINKSVRAYEPNRDLLTSINYSREDLPDPVQFTFGYEYDNLGRRTHFIHDQSGTSKDRFDAFKYNSRHELTYSQRYSGTDTANTSLKWKGHEFSYDYDPIGNRISGSLPKGVQTTYSPNNLNQYSGVQQPDSECFINEQMKLTATGLSSDDKFGAEARSDGARIIAGAPGDDDVATDAGETFFLSGSDWTDESTVSMSAYLSAGDAFGSSVDIDGEFAIVGAPTATRNSVDTGAAYILEYDSGLDAWGVAAELIPSDGTSGDLFGFRVEIDGDVAAVSSHFSESGSLVGVGAVYMYRRMGSPPTWQFQQKLAASDGAEMDMFGMGLALDGDRVLVGAWRNTGQSWASGSAYVFDYDTQLVQWNETAKLTASDGASGDFFGFSVALQGDTSVVGAYFDDDDGTSSGSAYVFDLIGGAWTQQAKLTAHDAAAGDKFGRSVAIDQGRIIVGADGESEVAAGAGAAYLFELHEGLWIESAKLAASDGAISDNLGQSRFSLTGDLAVIGVMNHDAAASNAGAAYVFDLPDINDNEVPDECEQNLAYDADGNLVEDDDFTYTWNAENRLIRVDPKAETTGALRETNKYDYLGRRVQRQVEEYHGTSWTLTVDTRYLYDGWNVIVEYDGLTGNVSKQFTWGLDLANSLQGAGGVGGLLACKDLRATITTSDDTACLYCYDGNGNIRALLDTKDGDWLAQYDYDPFGNLLSKSGVEAENNVYMFSSKPWDSVAGAYYYGFRYYKPELGRFVSRDPIDEFGGFNLYAFAGNNGITNFDLLGLTPEETASKPAGDSAAASDADCKCNIFLTFDDGPQYGTDDVVDLLERLGLRATFFLVGQHLDRGLGFKNGWRGDSNWTGAEIVSLLVRQGHCVANHSVTHPHQNSAYKNTQAQINEMLEMEKKLRTLLGLGEGDTTRFFCRLPGANEWLIGDVQRKDTREGTTAVAEGLGRLGRKTIGWDVEYHEDDTTEEAQNRLFKETCELCEGKSTANRKGGRGSDKGVVLLFHDRYHRKSKKDSAGVRRSESLERFLKKLKGIEGVCFKTLEEGFGKP